MKAQNGFKRVGEIIRKETDRLIIGYTFDLKSNTLSPQFVPNPHAGREHIFNSWRLKGGPEQIVKKRETISISTQDNRNDSF